MTLGQLSRHIVERLTPVLGDGEARATARILLEDSLGVSPTVVFTRGDRPVEPETVDRFNRFCDRIIAGEPPQYVVGKARFMGLDLTVSPSVLIPRPETAGLVDMITDDYGSRPDLHVADIGTGSGCIAIALARALVFPSVVGVDISPDALEVARANSRRLAANVDFMQLDILSECLPGHDSYDIIVSNPPYIADSEKKDMEPRVLDHEPANALFVPDSDPLEFYRAIGLCGLTALRPGGRLYFEINPLFADELARLLASQGYTDVVLSRDYLGRQRYARATRL